MSTRVLKALPGKLDIKRHSPSSFDIARLAEIYRILGDCILISSLPGKALRILVDIAWPAEIWRILGECLSISSLPGKTLRTLVDIASLA